MVKRKHTHTHTCTQITLSLFKLPCLWRKHSAKHIPFPQVQEFTCKVSEIWRKKKQRYFNNRPFWYSDGSTEHMSHNHKRKRTENPVIIISPPAKVVSSLWKKWMRDKRHVTCRGLTGPASINLNRGCHSQHAKAEKYPNLLRSWIWSCKICSISDTNILHLQSSNSANHK